MFPLHVAATNGRYKIVEHLVHQDVTNAKDNSGVSICAFDIRLVPLIALYISRHSGDSVVFSNVIIYSAIKKKKRVYHSKFLWPSLEILAIRMCLQ